MSFRELAMIEIKEVLRRWQAGHSVRKIGRDTSVGRKAAARYIHWPVELGVPRARRAAGSRNRCGAVSEISRSAPATSLRTRCHFHVRSFDCAGGSALA